MVKDELKNVEKSYQEAQKNRYSEAHAWDICHHRFEEAISEGNPPDKDYLSLNLGMYLANWGMYRGSAFVRNCNYREFEQIVEIILDKKYAKLLNIDTTEFIDPIKGQMYLNLLEELSKELSGELKKLRDRINLDVASGISQTLITKILLATLGCVPAYDTYFSDGVKKHGISATYNSKSVKQLAQFYQDNFVVLENLRKKLVNFEDKRTIYPQAKLLDMVFFGIGYHS